MMFTFSWQLKTQRILSYCPFCLFSCKRNIFLCKRILQKCSKKIGPPWKVLFFGTDNFSLTSLKPLCAKLRTGTLMSALGVVSKKGSVVTKFAELEKLPVLIWPLPNSGDAISNYDLGIVVSFGNLIPNSVIEGLPLGCINVHASLLPRWRGAAPIIHAVMNGDLETGVTIMKIKPHRFDVGEIIRQYRVPIMWNETAKEVEQKLSVVGAQLLMECIRDLPRCIDMATPQPDIGITNAPKIAQSMAVIKWSSMNAETVYNLHRALHHIYPLTTEWYGQSAKIHSVQLDKDCEALENLVEKSETIKGSVMTFLNSDSYSAVSLNSTCKDDQESKCTLYGSLTYIKRQKVLKVLCADNRYVLINDISIAGKKMKAQDFYNGFLSKKDNNWRFSS